MTLEELIAEAKKALDNGSFNEIEVRDGTLAVRLVRFSPSPYNSSTYVPNWSWPQP